MGCAVRVLIGEYIQTRQESIEDFKPNTKNNKESFIIYNSEYFDIKWPKVKLWFEGDGFRMRKGFKRMTEKRDPSFFVCQWDVCLFIQVVLQSAREPRAKRSLLD